MSPHACMLGFTFFHAFMLTFTCLDVHLHAYTHISMPMHLELCFCMLVCLDLCSLNALCYFPYACALCAMFVCLDLSYVCHAMCYCSLFFTSSFFLVFWPIGSDPIYTLWPFSSSIHQGPHQRVWIIPIFACLCLLASMLYACVSPSCSRLCHV